MYMYYMYISFKNTLNPALLNCFFLFFCLFEARIAAENKDKYFYFWILGISLMKIALE